MQKRILSLFVSIILIFSLLPEVSASLSSDVANAHTESVDASCEAKDNFEETYKAEESNAKSNATGGIEQFHTITSIRWNDSDSYIRLEYVASLDEIQSMLPSTLSVYLNGSNEITNIPISWELESDYSDSYIVVYDFRNYSVKHLVSNL